MSRLLFALALLSAFGAASAQKVYKWTDENGQVHFDSAPPTGQKTEQVRIQKSVEAPPAATAAAPAANPDGTPKPEMRPEVKEQLTKYCTDLRANLALLRNQGGRLVEQNPDGTRNALGAPEIAARLQGALDNEQKYCTSNAL